MPRGERQKVAYGRVTHVVDGPKFHVPIHLARTLEQAPRVRQFRPIVEAKIYVTRIRGDVTEMFRLLLHAGSVPNIVLFWPGYFDDVRHHFDDELASGACHFLRVRVRMSDRRLECPVWSWHVRKAFHLERLS